MLPKALIKGYDRNRLRNLLAVFFLALAIPTAVLIQQAYSQLKWETFHQYRGLAEELTSRIDARLIDMIISADARSFADYTFLVVTGDPSVNFLQRSPLSAYPVTNDPPGLLGYFQVDTSGVFSSPLLPPEDSDHEQFGIGGEEYRNRLLLTLEIQEILADNHLVRSRPETGSRRALAASPVALEAGLEEEMEADRHDNLESRARQLATEPERHASEGQAGATRGAKDSVDKLEAVPSEQAALSNETYTQQVFDRLNLPRQDQQTSPGYASAGDLDDTDGEETGEVVQGKQPLNTIGKVSDLKLDAALQKKSQKLEDKSGAFERQEDIRSDAPARTKRKEQIALPEAVMPAAREPVANASADLRISTFESEVDPLDFSMLDSGHLVLFRKVWREGERYIQGLLIDQKVFIKDIIDTPFMETALSDMSKLIVAHQEDVIHTVSGRDSYNYPNGNQALDGALVFRNRLSAPLDSLELIFSINRLPLGPGATVLGWVTLILALVLVSGFYTLYRLGLSQIELARQQQDFVSAVSHELKTPLTSIRMYGEMLKEGWVDEEKRKTYYKFIHDESERLTRLISNVLQLANITHSEPQFDLKSRKVGGLMSNIESKIASLVERAGYQLTFNRDDEMDQATVMIDEDCFAQIIINLVDNAIKFSENADNKTIEITSKLTSDSQVSFSVRDFGPGIPKDQMKKIFRLFYRPESELTRETVGTGIGLAIVHQLSVAMKGKVDIINRKPGAEFMVTFASVPNT
jgi:signal transduction histidine kinase